MRTPCRTEEDFVLDEDDVAMLPDGCHVWLRVIGPEGYAQVSIGSAGAWRTRYVHRLLMGSPKGMHVHHTCGHRWCVNRAHLEVVSNREHQHRHRSSHCAHGHEMSGENLYVYPSGLLKCKACSARQQQEHRDRLYAAGLTCKGEVPQRPHAMVFRRAAI